MNGLRQLAANKLLRVVLAVVVIALTLGLFGYYLATKPETLAALLALDPLTLALLTTAYVATIAVNGFVLWTSLKLINKPVKYTENVALTGYSSIVNFFGPLQSGPGFRAAYLKAKHGVSLKRFFYVTLIFYGFFALFNGIILAFATLSLLQPAQMVPVGIGVIAIALLAITFAFSQDSVKAVLRTVNLTNRHFWFIGVGAVLLSLTTAAAYFIELLHVDSSIGIGQTIVYTAAANLALFVSLTPGAIGFRESFLLLSQQLHGISTDTVIAASIIDRAFYVVFLLAMFVVLLLVGARSRLRTGDTR